MEKDFVLIIPARLESTRLPKKLLLEIDGISIIKRTYLRALSALGNDSKIYIATDSKLIKKHCESFGAKVLITSNNCLTGTDRIAEASKNINAKQFINLQGDEPIFPVEELKFFIQKAISYPKEISTGVTEIKSEEDYRNLSIPKMVFSKSNKLLYSSRAPIPSNKKNNFNFAFKHVCVYCFNKSHLTAFRNARKKSLFENQEDLEINRFLEMDMDVRCIKLNNGGKAVDTKNDFEIVSKFIKRNQNF